MTIKIIYTKKNAVTGDYERIIEREGNIKSHAHVVGF